MTTEFAVQITLLQVTFFFCKNHVKSKGSNLLFSLVSLWNYLYPSSTYSWSISQIFCLGRFGSYAWVNFFWVFLSNFWGCFFSIYENFFWKYCSVLTKKLDKMYLYFFFLMFFGVKIGYHSRFNPECNTERGFTDSLPMALGFVLQIRFSQLLIWQVFWRRKVNIRSTNHGIYHELHDA